MVFLHDSCHGRFSTQEDCIQCQFRVSAVKITYFSGHFFKRFLYDRAVMFRDTIKRTASSYNAVFSVTWVVSFRMNILLHSILKM